MCGLKVACPWHVVKLGWTPETSLIWSPNLIILKTHNGGPEKKNKHSTPSASLFWGSSTVICSLWKTNPFLGFNFHSICLLINLKHPATLDWCWDILSFYLTNDGEMFRYVCLIWISMEGRAYYSLFFSLAVIIKINGEVECTLAKQLRAAWSSQDSWKGLLSCSFPEWRSFLQLCT